MSTPNDYGGAAFLFVSQGAVSAHQICERGMTLRDWFAGQALTGWIAGTRDTEASSWDPKWWAMEAYKTADAMLAERAKPVKS